MSKVKGQPPEHFRHWKQEVTANSALIILSAKIPRGFNDWIVVVSMEKVSAPYLNVQESNIQPNQSRIKGQIFVVKVQ